MYYANSTVQPPPGYDISGPGPNRGYLIWIWSLLLSSLSTVFVALRLLSKACFYKKIHLEDYALVAALIFALVFNLFSIPCEVYGLGRHVWNIRPEDVIQFKKYFLAISWSFTGAHLFVKFSFVAFYNRLYYKQAYPWVIKVVYWAIFPVYGVFFIIHAIGPCFPMRKWWDPTYPLDKGYCFDQKLDYTIHGVFNLIMDVVIMLLPIPIVKQAKVGAQRKVLLSFVFGMGLFCCVTSLLRIVASLDRFKGGPADISWNIVGLMCWSMAEMSVGIVVCSMLQMNRLATWLYAKIFACAGKPKRNPINWNNSKPIIPQNSFFRRGRKPKDGRGHHTRDIESAMKSDMVSASTKSTTSRGLKSLATVDSEDFSVITKIATGIPTATDGGEEKNQYMALTAPAKHSEDRASARPLRKIDEHAHE